LYAKGNDIQLNIGSDEGIILNQTCQVIEQNTILKVISVTPAFCHVQVIEGNEAPKFGAKVLCNENYVDIQ